MTKEEIKQTAVKNITQASYHIKQACAELSAITPLVVHTAEYIELKRLYDTLTTLGSHVSRWTV